MVTLLGGTLAHLDHEPRFLQQSLLDCEAGDLLLLDVPRVSAPGFDPVALRRGDPLWRGGVPAPYAAWLQGPLWRHCPQIEGVEFHWELERHRPVPGSYALHGVATVKSSQRADRRFSLFRVGRYDLSQLAQCLRGLGWKEVQTLCYAGDQALCLYRKTDGERKGGSRAAASAGDAG